MKLRDIFDPLLKWWWLLLVATIVAGVSSFLATRPLPPIYRAQTTLVVGHAFYEQNPTGTEYGLSIKLAEAYSNIAMKEPIRIATMDALGLESLPEYNVAQLGDNQFLEISVIDTNPERAQAVANELANQLILMSPTSPIQQQQQRRDFVEEQLDDLQLEITQVEEQIFLRQEELRELDSAVELADAEADLQALGSKLTLLRNNYATLLDNTQEGAINTLSVIEPATLPRTPIGPNKLMTILLVSAIGFGLAAGAAHLLEYMDRTLKRPEDIERLLNVPVIGYIGNMGRRKDNWAYVANAPRSPIAESFRALRTNIEFTGVDRPLRSLLITSADIGDGKTTVASNLALSIAQSEKRVTMIDADLRRPSIHRTLQIPAQPGLSDMFRERLSADEVARSWKDKRIHVITAGGIPPNPAELLGSKKMDQILASLMETNDILVIDGPPVVVTDSTVLASKVDGVILVIRPGQTREEVAEAMMRQLRRVGANVIGVVLNRIPRRSASFAGAYPYYSPYYSENHSEAPNGKLDRGKALKEAPTLQTIQGKTLDRK